MRANIHILFNIAKEKAQKLRFGLYFFHYLYRMRCPMLNVLFERIPLSLHNRSTEV